jgi:glycosyltransferase involved in cell wall biosynthesis
VLPSYNEGLPMALLEAMSHGLPCITTKVGGIPELIKDEENGMLIDAGDIGALESKISYLIKNETVRQKIGERARETVINDYEASQFIKILCNVFDQLIY